MANRFDKPVESQYVSLYVPIPFEQLYRIGKEYNDRVDKAEKTLSDNIKQWGEFQSKSLKDMETWYDLTKGVVQPFVLKIVLNPDLIKTREGQSAISQLINNIDYASLSKLKQSAEAFKQRDAAILQLIRTGQYNPIWHDLDVSHYDTIGKNQVFNETDPLPYTSINDLVRPYVDNLKPSYLRQEGIWDVRGVSRDTTDEMVRQNWSSIFNTPQAQKHIDVLMSMGMDRQQAESEFLRLVYNRAAEAAYEDKQVNPYALALIKANGGNPTTPTNIVNRYDRLTHDSLSKQYMNSLPMMNQLSNMYKTDKNGILLRDDKGKPIVDESALTNPFAKKIKQAIDANDESKFNMVTQAGVMFEGIKKAFINSDLTDETGSIGDNVLRRLAEKGRKQSGTPKGKKLAIKFSNKSEYAPYVREMYEKAVDAVMTPTQGYSSIDMERLFGSKDPTLSGRKILTPRQYVLSNPYMKDFIKSQGLDVNNPIFLTSDAPFVSDTDFDLEKAIAMNPSRAIPKKVNGATVQNTPSGKEIVWSVTVQFPIESLPDKMIPLFTGREYDQLQQLGYSTTEDNDDGNVETTILVVEPVTDENRNLINMQAEKYMGTNKSENTVRYQESTDSQQVGLPHHTAGLI